MFCRSTSVVSFAFLAAHSTAYKYVIVCIDDTGDDVDDDDDDDDDDGDSDCDDKWLCLCSMMMARMPRMKVEGGLV